MMGVRLAVIDAQVIFKDLTPSRAVDPDDYDLGQGKLAGRPLVIG